MNLIIRAIDFNLLPIYPQLVKKLRNLTLNPRSGMNRELNTLIPLAEKREVAAQVLLAYFDAKLVGWCLLSRERSSMKFSNTWEYFEPTDGMLFEVYIHPQYRRLGIGTELMKVARRKAGPYRLCVAPWDDGSEGFYRQFQNYNAKWL